MSKRRALVLLPVLGGLLALFSGCEKTDGGQAAEEMAHEGPTMNFHRIDPQLATGGHLGSGGAAELARQGVTLVIDLRDKPPAEEQEQFEAAGVRWVNVPVVWKAPQKGDFDAFRQLMAANANESILVQCQANYRASAMTYLYRVTELGVPESEARQDLEKIWAPEGTWQDFIDEVLDGEAQDAE